MHDFGAVIWTDLTDRSDDQLHKLTSRSIDNLRLLVHIVVLRSHVVSHDKLERQINDNTDVLAV